MRLGFTGTSYGTTPAQRAALAVVFTNLRPDELHLGDCVGADAEAWALATCRRVGHPPSNPRARAYCAYDEERAPLPYLKRNRVIVDATECLVATPRTFKEELRSGTWATVRYARGLGRPVCIVWPDGTLTEERS